MVSKLYDSKGIKTSISLALVSCLYISCYTSSKPQGVTSTSQDFQSRALEGKAFQSALLTNVKDLKIPGLNFASCANPRNLDQFLFSSANRIPHKAYQIYEYDLGKQKEHRITHHNGNAIQACYHPNSDFIIYASTTDYEKEDLSQLFHVSEEMTPYLLPGRWEELKTDLYISSTKGDQIIRASYLDRSEQSPQYLPKSIHILYSITSEHESSIQKMSRYRKPLGALIKEKARIRNLKLSPLGKLLVWSQETQNELPQLQIFDINKKKFLTNTPSPFIAFNGVSWVDEGHLLISAKKQEDKQFKLYRVSTNMESVDLVAEAHVDLVQPLALGPQKILFSILYKDQAELFIANWKLEDNNLPTKDLKPLSH